MIVLEGPDGVGKTTLVEALAAAHAGPIVRLRHGPPGVGPYAEYWHSIDVMVEARATGALAVSDRLHVGELVYGTLLRGGAGMTLDQASVIDMRLSAEGAVLAHCQASADETIRRLMARDGGADDPKSGAKAAHAHAIRAAYLGLLGRRGGDGALPGGWLAIDMLGYPERLAAELLAAAKLRVSAPDGWIGPASASAVIVLPCASILGPTEHLAWLAAAARSVGMEREVAFASPGCEGLDWWLPGSVTVALGVLAAEACEAASRGFVRVRHRLDEHFRTSPSEMGRRISIAVGRG